MTEVIKQHDELAAQKQERLNTLRGSINEMKAELQDKKEQYKKSVATEDDKQTDQLFYEMEGLEKKIRADSHKLQTLETATAELLKADAIEKVKRFEFDVLAKHKEKAAEAREVVQQAKRVYMDALSVLDGIDADYQQERETYYRLIKQRGLSKQDINTGGDQLHHKIEYGTTLLPDKNGAEWEVKSHEIADFYKEKAENQRNLRVQERKAAVKKKQEGKK